MKNKVAKLVDIGKIEIFEEEVPRLREGELLIEVRAAGICGSDRHYFLHGGLGSFKQKLPMFMGHEPSGVVVEANKSTRFSTGDRVAIEPARHCGSCQWCSKEKFNLCSNSLFMGANMQGAFSQYLVATVDQLEKIPDTMSFETAALLEPLGIAVHSLNMLKNPSPQESVTIFGCGSIGLSLLYAMKKLGFTQIYMIDRRAYRAQFAMQCGATKTFTVDEDYAATIKNLTDGEGTQINIDAAGDELSINGCIQTAKMNGTVALIGIPETDFVPINPHKMRIKELTLQNVRRSNRTMPECLRLTDGDETIKKMISHRFPLEEIQKAFEFVADYKDNVIKCMITNF